MSTDDVPSASLCDQPTVQRDPQKRRVKLVQKHLLQVDFGLDDSEDDSDFDIEQHQESDSLDEMDEDEDQGLTLQSSDLPENKIVSPDNSEDDKFDKVQGLEYDNMEEEEEEDNEEDDEDEEEDSSESSEEDEEDEEEASEPQKPKGLHGIFGSVDSSDEDDEDYVPCKKKKKKLDAQEPVKKTSLDTVSNSFPAADAASHTSGQAQGQIKVLICCVCLSDQSADDDEIVECDNCGISVHEGCYGISESQSTASTESSASTEPWFCDACKAGVIPHCELCPNSGGIYKETDAGKWVHIVCALYTPGVAFGDVDRLCPVTLFEMAYTKWGAKECSLCEDSRFSRTGVCISCDAGMCRSYFHVTCAQREGLLTEAAPEEVMDIADPFFAYCKQHADKTTVKARRRHWLAIQSHVRSYTPKVIDDEMERSRFERKLNRHREKYAIARNKRPPSWVPTQKMVRHLHTSPYAVKAFMRKAELMGVVTHVENAHQEKPEMRKKAHLTPALSTEYIQYYFGRNMKIDSMRQNLKDLTTQNAKLQDQEKVLRNQYEKLSFDMDKLHELSARHRREGERIWNALADIGGKSIVVPEMFRPKKRQRSPSKKENPCSPPSVIHQCGICQQTTDQHLLTKCDSCHRHYHLSCLDPPLTRMPKKTKLMGWQCSQCVSSNSSASEGGCVPKVDEPRRLRENIKEPIKFRQMQHYEYAKGKRVSTVKGKKKKSKLPLIPVPETKSPAKSPVASPSAAAASPIHTSTPIPHVPTPLPPKETKLTRRKEIEPRIKEIRLSRGFAFESQPIPIVRLRKEDAASICVVCNKPGDVTNTVRCDECLLSYHFHCLEPPVKKSPKVRGYTWHCEACDPTDHSEEEENSSQSASTSSKSGKNNVTIASGPSKGSDSKR